MATQKGAAETKARVKASRVKAQRLYRFRVTRDSEWQDMARQAAGDLIVSTLVEAHDVVRWAEKFADEWQSMMDRRHPNRFEDP